MPARNDDLHGNVPDDSPVALLLVDVLNDLDFEEADRLEPQVRDIVKPLRALIAHARATHIPIIYVNDNHGRWRSDGEAVVEHVRESRGGFLAKAFAPHEEDYFILKPKHSGFYATTLDTVLRYLDAKVLIIAGLTGDRCVLFTANDAFLRDYEIVIPRDCVVSIDPRDNKQAIALMKRVLHAKICRSDEIEFVRSPERESGNPDVSAH